MGPPKCQATFASAGERGYENILADPVVLVRRNILIV